MVEDFPSDMQTQGECLVVIVEERDVQDSPNLYRYPFCLESSPAPEGTAETHSHQCVCW